MTVAFARLLTYGVIGLLAFGALSATPPIVRQPGVELLQVDPAVASLRQHHDTLGRGETVFGVLARGGVSEMVAREALHTLRTLDMRRIPAGMPVIVRSHETDSLPEEIVFEMAVDRRLTARRTADGWVGGEERLEWTTDTMVVGGIIRSHLYAALNEGAEMLPGPQRAELAYRMADVLEYRVDMSRDLREGDEFRVLFERQSLSNGTMRVGKVLATTFKLSGRTLEAVRFDAPGTRGEYFDAEGRTLRAAFLRAPLEFRRISSVFGRRRHPILGTLRNHNGVDYAAARGTPVRAVGDGRVIFAGVRGGYGRTVEIRHPNGFVTRYAHLHTFGRGIRSGAQVKIASTIGTVGSTGLATGPHLHFEVLVNGRHRDPRVALVQKGGEPIPAAHRPAFQREREKLLATLASPDGLVRLAAR